MRPNTDLALQEPGSHSTVADGAAVIPAVPSRLPAPRWLHAVRRDPLYSVVTIGIDVLYASAAVALALWWTPGPVHYRNIALITCLFVPIVILMLAARSMYRQKLSHSFIDEFEPVQTAIAVSVLATLGIMLIFVPPLPPGHVITEYVRPSDVAVRLWVCAAILMTSIRLVRSVLNRYIRRRYRVGVSALVVGSGPVAYQLMERMRQVPDYGLWPSGVLDVVKPHDSELAGVPYLGSIDDLKAAVRATGAQELIVALSSIPDDRLALSAQQAHGLGLRVRVVPRLMDVVSDRAHVEHLGGIPLLELSSVDPKGWQFAAKHLSDRVVAGLGLLAILPVFATLALLVKLSSPGPIFFAQPRVGRDGKVFDCLKFRSMRPADPAAAGFELKAGAAPGGVEGEDRRTRIGKIMRKTSLDELPQLVNVLKGDMSLVGPRPERPEFVELFEIQIRRYGERHRVKAGITGWAQVHGLRGQTSIADRAEFDNYYIENWSLKLDWKILILTVLAVLRSAED